MGYEPPLIRKATAYHTHSDRVASMSFFGFDSNLPRDKPQAKTSKGIFEHQDPFAGIAQARKLQAFQDDEPEEFVLLSKLPDIY